MATNVKKIARKLGARVVGKVPKAGGGAFGAARLAEQIRRLAKRTTMSTNQRTDSR